MSVSTSPPAKTDPLPAPQPCSMCEATSLWLDPYGHWHCPTCQPAPARAMVRRVMYLDGAGDSAAWSTARPVVPDGRTGGNHGPVPAGQGAAAATSAGLGGVRDEFDRWEEQPDARGRMGWEAPGLSRWERWWSIRAFEDLPQRVWLPGDPSMCRGLCTGGVATGRAAGRAAEDSQAEKNSGPSGESRAKVSHPVARAFRAGNG